MRAFLAVPCGEQLARELSTALDAVRSGPIGSVPVRWTAPESWHVTLQFLSDWPETRLETLKTALAALECPAPFLLEPGRIDAFPGLHAPRVLFLQLRDDGQIASLAADVRAIVNGVWRDGPQDNRPFRPHVTVARIREKLPRNDLKVLQNMEIVGLPPVRVEGFRLMGSTLGRSGARHTELASFLLRK